MENKYNYNTWEELFNEIAFDFELQYSPKEGVRTARSGVKYFTIYKSTIIDNGTIERKGNVYTYNPDLWYKVELLAGLFSDDKIIRTLYGK